MRPGRRAFLYTILALAAGRVLAARRAAVHAPSSTLIDAIIARETGGTLPDLSPRITLEVPEIAEDGAIVPVSVETTLPEVVSLALFVEKNPTPLAARFRFDASLDPYVSLRIKMNESCDVIAVVESAGKFYSARKYVRVVVGGCG
jgi:sulfur-oxidizing protein SoxY